MNNISVYPYGKENDAAYKRGMTLLDYFAGQALQVIIEDNIRRDLDMSYKACAEDAYAIATAMLEAREKALTQITEKE